MANKAFLSRLRRDRGGAVLVEFALAAPVFFMLMFGVFQIGIAMWNYNSLRGVAGEVSRWATVQYQGNNQVAITQIESYAQSVAVQSPFLLKQTRLSVIVRDAATQRVAGARELTLELDYSVPALIPFAGLDDFDISLDRSIFLLI